MKAYVIKRYDGWYYSSIGEWIPYIALADFFVNKALAESFCKTIGDSIIVPVEIREIPNK